MTRQQVRLAELTETHVLYVLSTLAESCRAETDLRVVNRRLSLAAGLTTVLSSPVDGTVDAPGPAAALGTFLGRCQERTGDWAWADSHLKIVGLDAVARDAEQIRVTVRPWTRTAVRAACSALREDHMDPHTQLLRKLFLDPIRLPPGATEVGSGQHRVCRARHAGAATIMVATNPAA